jgi:hypothetical protein
MKHHGYEVKQKCTSYDLRTWITPEITKNELYAILNLLYKNPGSLPIIDKAAELCTNLYVKTTDPVVFVTLRSQGWATETHKLVKRFCKVPYILIFADPRIGKLPYLNEIHYFVDDRRKTAMELAEAGKTVLMPIRDWNREIREDFEHTDSIVQIKGLEEILQNLDLFTK